MNFQKKVSFFLPYSNLFPSLISFQLIVIEEKQVAKFQVLVEANPHPTIGWQFNGEDMEFEDSSSSSRITSFGNGSLVIRDAILSDSGVYTVLADNGIGSVARLQVTLKVQPEKMPIEVSY